MHGHDVVETLFAVVGRRRSGRAFQLHDDARVALEVLERPFGDTAALIDEVGTQERHVVLAGPGHIRIDRAVDQERGNAGGFGLHHRGQQRLFLARGQEQDIDALRDHGIHVGDLLGRGTGGIGCNQVPSTLVGGVMEGLGLCDTPRIVAFHLRESDLVAILLGQGRQICGECT